MGTECTFPDCDCHFEYQEEGSDRCPRLDKERKELSNTDPEFLKLL